MRLGLFMMPLHPAGRPMHAYLAEDTEKALLLEKLGFDELFIGEHFSAATEPYPSPLMFAASLLPQTQRLVFGTGVINAPLRHPAMIAAEAAQFDHLSKGRFILGIGTGSTPTDIEMIGVSTDPRERGKMLAESIEMIENIWASDPPYDIEGKYWTTQIKDTVNPACFRLAAEALPEAAAADRDPVVVAGFRVGEGRRPQGLERDLEPAAVGRRTSPTTGSCSARAARKRAARRTATIGASAARSSSPRPTRRRASALYSAESGYRHFFGHMHKVYTQLGRLGVLKSRPDMRDDEVTVDTFIDQRTIFGSPKTVLKELVALRETVGPFGTLLLTSVDWAGPNAAWERESWTRLAQEVMPALAKETVAA